MSFANRTDNTKPVEIYFELFMRPVFDSEEVAPSFMNDMKSIFMTFDFVTVFPTTPVSFNAVRATAHQMRLPERFRVSYNCFSPKDPEYSILYPSMSNMGFKSAHVARTTKNSTYEVSLIPSPPTCRALSFIEIYPFSTDNRGFFKLVNRGLTTISTAGLTLNVELSYVNGTLQSYSEALPEVWIAPLSCFTVFLGYNIGQFQVNQYLKETIFNFVSFSLPSNSFQLEQMDISLSSSLENNICTRLIFNSTEPGMHFSSDTVFRAPLSILLNETETTFIASNASSSSSSFSSFSSSYSSPPSYYSWTQWTPSFDYESLFFSCPPLSWNTLKIQILSPKEEESSCGISGSKATGNIETNPDNFPIYSYSTEDFEVLDCSSNTLISCLENTIWKAPVTAENVQTMIALSVLTRPLFVDYVQVTNPRNELEPNSVAHKAVFDTSSPKCVGQWQLYWNSSNSTTSNSTTSIGCSHLLPKHLNQTPVKVAYFCSDSSEIHEGKPELLVGKSAVIPFLSFGMSPWMQNDEFSAALPYEYSVSASILSRRSTGFNERRKRDEDEFQSDEQPNEPWFSPARDSSATTSLSIGRRTHWIVPTTCVANLEVNSTLSLILAKFSACTKAFNPMEFSLSTPISLLSLESVLQVPFDVNATEFSSSDGVIRHQSYVAAECDADNIVANNNERLLFNCTSADYTVDGWSNGGEANSIHSYFPTLQIDLDRPSVVRKIFIRLSVTATQNQTNHPNAFFISLLDSRFNRVESKIVFTQQLSWLDIDTVPVSFIRVTGITGDKPLSMSLLEVDVQGQVARDCFAVVQFDFQGVLAHLKKGSGKRVVVDNASISFDYISHSNKSMELVAGENSMEWSSDSLFYSSTLKSNSTLQFSPMYGHYFNANFNPSNNLSRIVQNWITDQFETNYGLAIALADKNNGFLSIKSDSFQLAFSFNIYAWRALEYSTNCSSTCGEGIQTRQVYCVQWTATSTEELDCAISSSAFLPSSSSSSIVDDAYCDSSAKPPSTAKCENHSDCSIHLQWTESCMDCSHLCSSSKSCSTLPRSPRLQCTRVNATSHLSSVQPDSVCSSITPPPSISLTCSSCECSAACQSFWSVTNWSECGAGCGVSTRTRNVVCVQSLANGGNTTVADSFCDSSTRPASSEPCLSTTGECSESVWDMLADTRVSQLRNEQNTSNTESLIGLPYAKAINELSQTSLSTSMALVEKKISDLRLNSSIPTNIISKEAMALQNEVHAEKKRLDLHLAEEIVEAELLEVRARKSAAKVIANTPVAGLKAPPNINFLGAGYDIVFGCPLNSDAAGLDPGFRAPVVDLSFESKRLSKDLSFMIPDSVEIRSSTMNSFSAEYTSTKSSLEHRATLDKEVEIEVSESATYAGLGSETARFSASTSFKRESQSLSKADQISFSSISRSIAYTAFFTSLTPATTMEFRTDILNLPNPECCEIAKDEIIHVQSTKCSNYSQKDCNRYMDILKVYGTHVLIDVVFGGVSFRLSFFFFFSIHFLKVITSKEYY